MTATRRRDLVPLLALGGLVAFLLRQALLFGRTFYVRDIHVQWYSQVESFVRAVAAGALPLWDPHVGFGMPLLANPNTEVLYPFTWLNLVMPPAGYYTVFFAAHLALGAAGLYALALSLGMSRGAATVAAGIWTASGPVLSLGCLWNHLAAAAWLPWILVAARRAMATGRGRDMALWGAATALQLLAGSPDVALMTAALVAAETLITLRTPAAGRSPRQILWTAAGAVLLALALAAGQILPSLELASRSGRSGLGMATRTYWSLHPWSLLQLAVPIAWNDLALTADLRAALFESREPLLFSCYLGLPALLLAASALVGPARPRKRGLAAAAAGAVLLAMGPHTPIYGIAVRLIPPLGVLRYPSKALIVAAFACALLAGMGLDAWLSPGRRRHAALAALGVGLLAAAAAVAVRPSADTLGPWIVAGPAGVPYAALLAPARARLVHAALAAFALGLLGLLRSGRPPDWAVMLAGALSVGELAVTHRDLNPTAPRALLSVRPEVAQQIHQEDGRRLYVVDYQAEPQLSLRDLGRANPYAPREAGPPWSGALAMRAYPTSPMGSAWALYESYARDLLGLQPVHLAELHTLLLRSAGTPVFVRLLQLGAVSQVVALHTRGLEELQPAVEIPSPFPDTIKLLSVPDPLPRAYAVAGVRVAEGPAALQLLTDPGFDFRREVILASGTPRAAENGFNARVRVAGSTPDRMLLEADLSAPGHVVLVDGYDPGWRASVDGRPAPLLPANLAFRAVAVTAGAHRIELVYRPRAVVLGLALSGAGLVAALWLGFDRRFATA